MPGNSDANPPALSAAATQKTSATFQIKNAKLYDPVATFSINDNIKILENLNQEFKEKFLATNIDLK